MSVKNVAKRILETLSKYESTKAEVQRAECAALRKQAIELDNKAAKVRRMVWVASSKAAELQNSSDTIKGLAEKLK